MKKTACIALAAVALSVMGATASFAYHGHGGRIGVGVWVGPGWGPGWGGSYYPYYPYYPYYSAPPVVVAPEQQPGTYVQPEQQNEEQDYWYYCPEPKGYYPYVKKCPKGWMKVVPPSSPEPSSPEEEEE